jgi:iron complex outermembrane receptor protein
VIGGFYLREHQINSGIVASNNQAIPVPTITCATAPVAGICLARPTLIQLQTEIADPDTVNESYAGFGQATFSLTDWFRVTGGIRFTHESKAALNGTVTSVYSFPAGLRRTYPSQGFAAFDDTSYRAGLEVDVAPQSMLYGHFSTASHAGGFNLGVEAGPNRYRYDPEQVKSYVIGIKNRFFNNRLQLNVEGFWLDYKNYQFNSLGYINDGSSACSGAGIRTACPLSIRTDNARGARLRGIEADLTWRVFDYGTLDLNVLYNDGRYRSFDVANPFTGAITSYAGVQLPAVNKWTIGAGYTHIFPLENDARIIATARTQYRDGKFIWYTKLPSQYQEGYTRTDFSLGYEAPEGRWSVKAFVRNLEDKATVTQGAAPNQATGIFFSVLNPPRTYGLNLGFHF